jgi:hypothetical protein
MKLLPAKAAPGDFYLVDVGELVPVVAVNARAAFQIANSTTFGKEHECPYVHPVVYQFGRDAELLAVYE